MSNSIDPFTWKPNFLDFKKNIIEDDIIPDELLQEIQNKIKNHCLSNYQSYKPSANVGYSTSCNDTGGVSNCNCDISGVNCYPAGCSGDCSDSSQASNCQGCYSIYNAAGGTYDKNNNNGKICNSDECSNYKGP